MLTRAITVGSAFQIGGTSLAHIAWRTAELGTDGMASCCDNSLSCTSGTAGGARVGAFVLPRMLFAFGSGARRANDSPGSRSINVGILSGRLTVIPVILNAVSFIVPAGSLVTNTRFIESDGENGVLGEALVVAPAMALRVDGIAA